MLNIGKTVVQNLQEVLGLAYNPSIRQLLLGNKTIMVLYQKSTIMLNIVTVIVKDFQWLVVLHPSS